jgi:hypothetical protein
VAVAVALTGQVVRVVALLEFLGVGHLHNQLALLALVAQLEIQETAVALLAMVTLLLAVAADLNLAPHQEQIKVSMDRQIFMEPLAVLTTQQLVQQVVLVLVAAKVVMVMLQRLVVQVEAVFQAVLVDSIPPQVLKQTLVAMVVQV